jgi:uncharacterized protein YndB with AHSA1/START domain
MYNPRTFTQHVDIDRPAGEVWAIVADYDLDPSWRAGVETMTPRPPGPVRTGTTTHEVLRFGGRTYRTDGIVTAVEPGHRFTWEAGIARGARRVTPAGPAACRVDLDLELEVRGAQRLLAPLLARLMRRTLAGDTARLRELAMARATGTPDRIAQPGPIGLPSAVRQSDGRNARALVARAAGE